MIYLVEDDDSIRKLVIYALESQGFSAEGFEHPQKFWEAMEEKLPELILLDIMLPGEDGISILQRIRQKEETSAIPVLMLTAKNTEYDRVQGLDAGADDYISKPFGMMELIARIRAVLRRKAPRSAAAEYQIGILCLRPGKHEVLVNGEKTLLTYKEYMLLKLLMENQGFVLTREILMDRIWGLGAERENRTLDVHIRTLRAKLKDAGRYIRTIRGVGYQLVEYEE